MADSQAVSMLAEALYDDPSQLSQALRQRAGSDQPFHFTTSTEGHSSANSASAFALPQPPARAVVPQHLPIAVAQLDHALASRRAANAKYVKPALPNHHSAPTSTGFVGEPEGAPRMHHTFNGMDAPGDTQPDSQIYKEYTSGVFPTVEVLPHAHSPKSLFVEHQHEDDEEDEDDDLPTDDIQVAESSQPRNNPTVTSPTIIDIDDRAPAEHNSVALTSPLKFQTPVLAGRKRDSLGHIFSSVARTNTTPGTVASASTFFPVGFGAISGPSASGPLMSLTQAWQNTQAPTSPAVGGAIEDVVFMRPSPNFTNVRRSSPIPAYSSPIKAMRPETSKSDPVVRSSSEPRTEYVTMKQSQEKRNPSTEDEDVLPVEQDSWQELAIKVKRKKAKEQFHQRAARSLSNISAPTPLVQESGRKRTANARYSSSVKPKPLRSIIHEDPQEEDDDSMDELSQSMCVNGRDAEDSPDELSQDMPSTARALVKYNSTDNSVQVPKTSSHPQHTPSGRESRRSSQQATPSSQLQRESRLRAPGSQSLLRGTFRPQSSKDSVAVMDSQPDVTADFESVPRPKALRFPSSPSANQYSINQTTMAKTGYTSQVISSSMPPMPPKSSPEEPEDALEEEEIPEEEERVPSSPPMLTHKDGVTHEEDIEYDEHTYDEYVEGSEGEGVVEPQDAAQDVVMEEDEDLPVAKAQFDEEVAGDGAIDDEEMDLVQPQKIDLGTDQEVVETLEHEESRNHFLKDEELGEDAHHIEANEPTHMPRMQRQNTIPETDALDETQPSFFPDEATNDTEMKNHIHSMERFETAQEELFGLQYNRPAPLNSKEDGSDVIQIGDRIRSVNDIYDLPETQQSGAEEEFEMPRLSGLDADEEDVMPGSSLAPPSAKRRKVTYTAKRRVFRSPIKPLTDSEPLSDPPPSPPLKQVQQELEDTPSKSSAQEQEGQSGLAAARATEEAPVSYSRGATRKPRGPRPSKPHLQRKGALKPISRELLQSLSSPVNSPSKPRYSVANRANTPLSPTRRGKSFEDVQASVDMPDADNETDELAAPTTQPTNVEAFVEINLSRDGTPPGDVLVPNRVFASWPGSHYYPATCIGRLASRQLQIRYDDGNITSLDAVHVRALSLRTGDQVKVDESGMKKHTYVVVGFKDKIDDLDGEQFPTTDHFGYATIVLEEKRRESLPATKAVIAAERISVPMASIYLTTGLWTRLRDRSFNFSPLASPNKAASRVGTPITEHLATPSFTRKGTTAPSLLRDATARAGSIASTVRSVTTVFSNMAFVLTSTAVDVDKEALAKLIKTNGGQVLEHGFHELFDYEPTDVPSSQSRRRSASAEESAGITLKHAYKDLGFVVLISDSHSRSTKYIQALALNVPCLHLRWIQDSLAATRALSFAKYLLPAGVSKFLDPNGVLRSRTMSIYDPANDDISFDQTIQDRDLLLHHQTVLLVTGKSKKEIEKRQPFIFLTHALGSANVGRCADLAAAAQMLTTSQWDWVYVDNGERGVAEAAAELFGTLPTVGKGAGGGAAKVKKGKKRKRDESEASEELVARGELSGRKVRITCAEFVIQSLILGALVEE